MLIPEPRKATGCVRAALQCRRAPPFFFNGTNDQWRARRAGGCCTGSRSAQVLGRCAHGGRGAGGCCTGSRSAQVLAATMGTSSTGTASSSPTRRASSRRATASACCALLDLDAAHCAGWMRLYRNGKRYLERYGPGYTQGTTRRLGDIHDTGHTAV